MAEETQYLFSFQELAEILVREKGIQAGDWGIVIRFGLQATNIGPDAQNLTPAAIVPVMEIGIQKSDAPTNLTVDAGRLSKKK